MNGKSDLHRPAQHYRQPSTAKNKWTIRHLSTSGPMPFICTRCLLFVY